MDFGPPDARTANGNHVQLRDPRARVRDRSGITATDGESLLVPMKPVAEPQNEAARAGPETASATRSCQSGFGSHLTSLRSRNRRTALANDRGG